MTGGCEIYYQDIVSLLNLLLLKGARDGSTERRGRGRPQLLRGQQTIMAYYLRK